MKIMQYTFALHFFTPILGLSPASKEIYEKYILSRLAEDDSTLNQDVRQDELDMIHEPTEDDDGEPYDASKPVTVFHRDDDGIYLLSHQVKGFLKSAANICRDNIPNPTLKASKVEESTDESDAKPKKKEKAEKGLGIKALRSKVENHIFVEPRHIWLASNSTGIITRPLRAQTPQGPRVTIARSEYLAAPFTIQVTLKVVPHKEIDLDVIQHILSYGELQGISQWRGAGYGSFTYELLDVK